MSNLKKSKGTDSLFLCIKFIISLIVIVNCIIPIAVDASSKGTVSSTKNESVRKYRLELFFTGNIYGNPKIDPRKLNNILNGKNVSLLMDTGSMKDLKERKDNVLENLSYNYLNVGKNEILKGNEFLNSITANEKYISSSLLNENNLPMFSLFKVEKIKVRDGLYINVVILGAVSEDKRMKNSKVRILSLEDSLCTAFKKLSELNITPHVSILLYDGILTENDMNILDKYPSIKVISTCDKKGYIKSHHNKIILSEDPFLSSISKVSLGISDESSPYIEISKEKIDLLEVEDKKMPQTEATKPSKASKTSKDKPKEVKLKNMDIFIENDLDINILKDSPLADLFSIATYSHFLGYKRTSSPVVVLSNILTSKIKRGEYKTSEIMDLFLLKDEPIAITISLDTLKKIMEESFSIYNTVTDKEKISVKKAVRIQDLDFYENINIKIDLSKPEGERVSILKINKGRSKDTNQITLLLPKRRYQFFQSRIPELNKSEIVWDPKISYGIFLCNYLNTVGTYTGECNYNWILEVSGIKSLPSIIKEKNPGNSNTLNLSSDVESPLGQYILSTVKEKAGTDIALIKKDNLNNQLPKGKVNRDSIVNLTKKPLSVVRTKIPGSKLKSMVKDNLIDKKEVEMYGIKADYTKKGNESKINNIRFVDDKEIEDDRDYTVALVSDNVEGAPLNDILSKEISDDGIVDFDFKPNIKEISPELLSSGNIKVVTQGKKDGYIEESSSIPFDEEAGKNINNFTLKDKGYVLDKVEESNLPKTGHKVNRFLPLIGVIILIGGIALIVYLKKKNKL